MDVQLNIDRFKRDLPLMDATRIIRKHITFGSCFVFEDEKHFDLKAEVAERFNLHPSEVLLVGSAKMGFSIAPRKSYRLFGDQSDIDIAIVSSQLFDEIWAQVLDYTDSVGYYWPQDRERDFKHFLFQGWIRPDKLPPAHSFERCKEWWEFFRTISNTGVYGPYKIAAGLYKSWHHLERYQSICIKQCQQDFRGLL